MSNDPSAMFVALAVVLLLAIVLRWVFRPSHPRRGVRQVDAAESPNLGLLVVVAPGLDKPAALRQRDRLRQAGIRSSMSKRRDGRLDVLVFRGDVDNARLHLEL